MVISMSNKAVVVNRIFQKESVSELLWKERWNC